MQEHDDIIAIVESNVIGVMLGEPGSLLHCPDRAVGWLGLGCSDGAADGCSSQCPAQLLAATASCLLPTVSQGSSLH